MPDLAHERKHNTVQHEACTTGHQHIQSSLQPLCHMWAAAHRKECGHGMGLRGQIDALLEHGEEGTGSGGIDAEPQGLQHDGLHPQQVPGQEAVVCNAGEVLDGGVALLFVLGGHQHAGDTNQLQVAPGHCLRSNIP